jgi:N-acetylmuramoyl-L-alanine amidase
LGRQYSLRIVERQGDLVLVALTREDPFHPIEIGRTRGTSENFSRIDLQPGWRLTRRMYNGEPLGHLYLTNEQSLQALLAASPRWSALSPPGGASSSEPSVGRVEPAPDAELTTPDAEPTLTVPDLFRRTPESDANTSEPSAPEAPEVIPDLFRRTAEPETDVSEPSEIRVEVTEPEAEDAEPGDTGSGVGAIAPTTATQQLPVPDDLPPPATAETPASISEEGRREVEFRQNPAPQGPNSQPVNPPSSELPSIFINPSPLPSGSSTPNNPSPNSPNSPPPSPSDLANTMGFSFRVIVEADSPDTQERVREIVPDAFRTTLDGKTVIQAGLFYSRDEANALQQQLIQANLRAMVVSIN